MGRQYLHLKRVDPKTGECQIGARIKQMCLSEIFDDTFIIVTEDGRNMGVPACDVKDVVEVVEDLEDG